ncbi:unnamed protein product [Effrenium voratum]|nr:unnamed protein product [Effrenium voratum]
MQVTWRQPNPGLRLPTALIFSLLLCVPAERVHEVLREFPSCSGGTIHLDGLYRTSYVEFPEDCELIGARGTEVVLDGSVHFLRNATLHGSIAFRGGGAERCVDVEGSLDFVDPDIEFTDCGGSKVDDGGALYVEHSLNIHNGNITFRNSTATDGGCLFVGQDLQMHGGSMRFEGCQARDCGGGRETAVQRNGHEEELRWWEVTRLVRKIALALLCSAYPVTLHPFTLMTGMGLVLVIALVLELKYEPYKAEAWNRSEHWLLMTSMILVLITIYQHSIELTWSHSVQETSQVLCVILSLVFVPAYAQLYLVTKHLLQERFPKA